MDLSLLAQVPDVVQTVTQVFNHIATNISVWSVLGAVIPALALVAIFYFWDVNPEPRTVVVITFVLGVLISIPVLMVNLPIKAFLVMIPNVEPIPEGATYPIPTAAAVAFLAAALPEEFFKFLIVWLYCSRHKAFDEPMDGVIYGVTASLGFAALENVLYASTNNWWIILVRAFTAVPCHAFLGAIMGYYIGQAKFKSGGGFGGMVFGLFCAWVLHGLYDFFLMVGYFAKPEWVEVNANIVIGFLGAALVVLVLLGFWTFYLVSRLSSQQSRV